MEEENRRIELEYKYREKLNRLVIIKNIISLICFTILAIIFKNFWIVFGAILFLSYISKEDN